MSMEALLIAVQRLLDEAEYDDECPRCSEPLGGARVSVAALDLLDRAYAQHIGGDYDEDN